MEITQRTAAAEDAAVLLMWRNGAGARQFSQNSDPISIDEHTGWFISRLTRSKGEPFSFFESDNNLIGMSRLDFVPGSDNKYEISVLVDPEHYGKGFGKRILNMTCENFLISQPKKTIVARVHIRNIISQRLFKNAGFVFLLQEGDFLTYEKTN